MQSNKLLFFAIIGLAMATVIGLVVGQQWWQTANPIELSVLYSTEKEAWLNEVVANFDGRANGRPIQVTLEKMGSREIYLAVLDGSRQPDVISPASSLQIAILQDLSARSGVSVINTADATTCRPVLMAQIGTSGKEGGNAIKLFTIAFGSDADTEVLRQMAESTGGKQYSSDPTTISQVYAEIALFF